MSKLTPNLIFCTGASRRMKPRCLFQCCYIVLTLMWTTHIRKITLKIVVSMPTLSPMFCGSHPSDLQNGRRSISRWTCPRSRIASQSTIGIIQNRISQVLTSLERSPVQPRRTVPVALCHCAGVLESASQDQRVWEPHRSNRPKNESICATRMSRPGPA